MDISLYATLFLTPGEACLWALSRFKRDCLSNIWGNGAYPQFIKFFGVIVTDHSSFQECAKNGLFTSKKELDFFRGCKFFHLLNMDNSISSYEQIHPTEFSVLAANLFHSRVDYQLSTTSTYRIGGWCQFSFARHSHQINLIINKGKKFPGMPPTSTLFCPT